MYLGVAEVINITLILLEIQSILIKRLSLINKGEQVIKLFLLKVECNL